MTPILPRSLDDHVLISRMAYRLRPFSDAGLSWVRFSVYENVEGLSAEDARRLDVYALAAELRRRETIKAGATVVTKDVPE